jgi:hypothetical protein
MISTPQHIKNLLAPGVMRLEQINSGENSRLEACLSPAVDENALRLKIGVIDISSKDHRYEKVKYRELGSYLIHNTDSNDVYDRIKEIFLDLGLKLFPSDVRPSV